jgi:Flp pilus assembly protein TadB
MEQERKEKEEKRRKKEGSRRRWVSAGSRRKDLVVALRHLTADTSRPTHWPPRPTAGSRRPWVWFFFLFFPSGLIFFFVVVRMIKSPNRVHPSPLGFSFDALETNW